MKKHPVLRRAIGSLAALFAVLSLTSPLVCRAADDPVGGLLEGLPPAIADRFPDGALAGGGEAAATALDASFFLSFLSDSVSEAAGAALGPAAALLVTVFLSAILSAFAESAGPAVEKALGFASGLALTLAILDLIRPLWEAMTEAIALIGLTLKSFLPVVTAVGAASGRFTAASVDATWLSILLMLFEQLNESLLGPLFGVCFGFVILSAFTRFSGAPDLSGASAGVKKLFLFFLTLIGSVLSIVMAYQSVLAKTADGALIRSLRFASGRLIPILGGTLGEMTDSYLASLSVIRGTAGTVAVAALAVGVVPILLRLLFCRLTLGLAGFLAGLFGCSRENAALSEAFSLPEAAAALLCLCSALTLLLLGTFTAAL